MEKTNAIIFDDKGQVCNIINDIEQIALICNEELADTKQSIINCYRDKKVKFEKVTFEPGADENIITKNNDYVGDSDFDTHMMYLSHYTRIQLVRILGRTTLDEGEFVILRSETVKELDYVVTALKCFEHFRR